MKAVRLEYKPSGIVAVLLSFCIAFAFLLVGCVNSFSLGTFCNLNKPLKKQLLVDNYKIDMQIVSNPGDSLYTVSFGIVDTNNGKLINEAISVLDIQKTVRNQFAGVRQSQYKIIPYLKMEPVFDPISGSFRFVFRNMGAGNYSVKITVSSIAGVPLEKEVIITYNQKIVL